MTIVVSVFLSLRSLVRSRAALHLEILALRHQLQILERSRRSRLRLAAADRVLWVWFSRIWTAWGPALVLVQPATVVAWHLRGFRLFWAWKSRHRTGRPNVPADVRVLIRTMSQANPLWGAPRIHGELRKLGIALSQSTVAKYMVRRRRPPSQTWRTFLANHVGQVMAADFFVVPTVTYRLLFVLVLFTHERRRVAHVAITDHPTAAWTAQQLRNAFPHEECPAYLLHDRDGAFTGIAGTLAAMQIQEVVTAPRSPWQNAYVERFIGSIRRECLDHVIVVSAAGLQRIVKDYVAYYMRSRTHLSLDKDSPTPDASSWSRRSRGCTIATTAPPHSPRVIVLVPVRSLRGGKAKRPCAALSLSALAAVRQPESRSRSSDSDVPSLTEPRRPRREIEFSVATASGSAAGLC